MHWSTEDWDERKGSIQSLCLFLPVAVAYQRPGGVETQFATQRQHLSWSSRLLLRFMIASSFAFSSSLPVSKSPGCNRPSFPLSLSSCTFFPSFTALNALSFSFFRPSAKRNEREREKEITFGLPLSKRVNRNVVQPGNRIDPLLRVTRTFRRLLIDEYSHGVCTHVLHKTIRVWKHFSALAGSFERIFI